MSQFIQPSVKLIGNWEKDIKSFSFFPYKNITACNIKSIDGVLDTFNEISKEGIYKYTKLIDTKTIMSLIDYFKVETQQIKILKQEPLQKYVSTYDEINIDNELKIWIMLNEHEKFKNIFTDKEIILKMGEIIVFNSNSYYESKNLSDIDKYILEITCLPNKWLRNLLEIRDKVVFLRE